MDTRTSPIPLRLEQLRLALAAEGAQALIVPSADPHLSEYLPERWQAREYFSGFTGSMGTLVVTAQKAALFADSRYWEQAEVELKFSGIELQRIPTGASTHHIQWLVEQLQPGDTVCVDGQALGLAAAKQLREAFEPRGLALRTTVDVVGQAWAGRPGLPAAPIYEHAAPQASETRASKLQRVRAAMARHGATHHFISSVDDVAWLTNLRGTDVDYNPVFMAHLLLGPEGGTLFVPPGKLPAALATSLQADGLKTAPYEQAGAALGALPEGATLLLDPGRSTLALREQVAAKARVVEAINPSVFFKSQKNDIEAGYVRQTMEQDAAAMCEFYAWFEQALGRERITELTVDERLSAARARRPGFVSLSFSTIAGFNANGALPHYRATPASHSVIEGQGLLLIDSGGQYLGGTTDITRVWPIGTPSAAQKHDYTLVLKGTLALSRTRFPRGTLSPMLDAIARAPLWEHGLDYGHGTGHGVGYFMNVHEGPQSISRAVPAPHMAMEPGMITSIEPGLYRPGQWGIRIENLVLNRPLSTSENGAFGEMLEFETLTLCPIDTRCIERSLLRPDEVAWLNAYHAMVRARVAPLVQGDALAWLNTRTEAI